MSDNVTKPLLAMVLTLGIASGLAAQGRRAAQATLPGQMILVSPADVRWGPAPEVFPKGAQAAILQGDLSKAEAYTVRLKMPDSYRIAPHTHPVDEHVTVLKGTLMVGVGSQFDESAARAMPAGSFIVMPKGHPHFVWSRGETIIQSHGMGPWGMNYINSADDPRHKSVTR